MTLFLVALTYLLHAIATLSALFAIAEWPVDDGSARASAVWSVAALCFTTAGIALAMLAGGMA